MDLYDVSSSNAHTSREDTGLDLAALLASVRTEAINHKEALGKLKESINSCLAIVDAELTRLNAVRDSIEEGIVTLDAEEPDIDEPAYEQWVANHDKLEDKLYKLGDKIDDLEDIRFKLSDI